MLGNPSLFHIFTQHRPAFPTKLNFIPGISTYITKAISESLNENTFLGKLSSLYQMVRNLEDPLEEALKGSVPL